MSKISNSVGRNDNFLAKARKLSILPTSLDIFDIQQHYVRVLYISPYCIITSTPLVLLCVYKSIDCGLYGVYLMPFSTVFHLYRRGQCICSYFREVPFYQ